MKTNILGTEYELNEKNWRDDELLEDNYNGYCDTSVKKLVVEEMNERKSGQKEDLSYYKKSVKRHEIIHGFLYESGLDTCCGWFVRKWWIGLLFSFRNYRKRLRKLGAYKGEINFSAIITMKNSL